ncbi:unnamed protein product [Dicrocoelium dendriticum]|nr:unnamed protein product [Dicrocoelium dendriticum]
MLEGGQAKADCNSDGQAVLRTPQLRHHSKHVIDQIQLVLTTCIINKDGTAETESSASTTQGSLVECKSPDTTVNYADMAAKVPRNSTFSVSTVANTTNANRATSSGPSSLSIKPSPTITRPCISTKNGSNNSSLTVVFTNVPESTAITLRAPWPFSPETLSLDNVAARALKRLPLSPNYRERGPRILKRLVQSKQRATEVLERWRRHRKSLPSELRLKAAESLRRPDMISPEKAILPEITHEHHFTDGSRDSAAGPDDEWDVSWPNYSANDVSASSHRKNE